MLSPSDQQLLERLPAEERAAHGIPAPEEAQRRTAAAAVASSALADLLRPGGIRVSTLGPSWSRDIDVHLRALPPPERLSKRGWLPLDGLLNRLGHPGRNRWAVVSDGEVLATADLTTAAVPDPVTAVQQRARRRGEVRLREVLELRVLLRSGRRLSTRDPVARAAAGLEALLGGDELASVVEASSVSGRAPVPLRRPLVQQARHAAGLLRRATRRRVVVAVSGVDGSGKSSLTERLAADLRRLGVPASVVWTRPGMRLKLLAAAARLFRRLRSMEQTPGVRAVAVGQPPPARRGALGWLWLVAVSSAFWLDVRQRHLRSTGVVLYDRHLLDALVTLDFVYAGLDLSLPSWIVHRALPSADLAVYVDVPAAVAVARKPGDLFGEHAVRSQLQSYERRLPDFPGLVVLDGQADPDELTMQLLRRLTDLYSSDR